MIAAFTGSFVYATKRQIHEFQQHWITDSLIQERIQEKWTEQMLHYWEMVSESEADTEMSYEWLEALELLSKHPLNLNTATLEALQTLFFLTDHQRLQLISYRLNMGKIMSLYELQTIDGFDPRVIEAMRPFVTVGDEMLPKWPGAGQLFAAGDHVFFLRFQQILEPQLGYIQNESQEKNQGGGYPGSPYRLYTRYRFNWYNHISIGFTAEKDPGEEFFRGSQPHGFDFYSFHLHVKDLGRLRQLSVGDYMLQFGQGLQLWTGMGFGKSSESMDISKNGLGIRPYTSVDENRFMRGIAASVRLGAMDYTGFFSSKKRDASLHDSPESDERIYRTLLNTGLHRTPSELTGKNTARETIYGMQIAWKKGPLYAAFVGYGYHLDGDIKRVLSHHNQFQFSSREHYMLGMHYRYLWRNIHFFGEASLDPSGHPAFIQGLMTSIDPKISLSVLLRNYHAKHQSPLSSAFGENSTTANEKGIYLGIEYRPHEKIRINAYADHFSFPWMRFLSHWTSQGRDYLAQATFSPNRTDQFTARLKWKQTFRDDPTSQQHIRNIAPATRMQFRMHAAFQVSNSVGLRNRFERVWWRHAAEKNHGWLFYQDVLYRPLGKTFSFTFRYALFDTDGFSSRIYAYEHDVLYAFSFPFYSDKGFRYYLLVKYQPLPRVDMYARWAGTVYYNRATVGSGLETIEGNTRTEIKLQLRYRF